MSNKVKAITKYSKNYINPEPETAPLLNYTDSGKSEGNSYNLF